MLNEGIGHPGLWTLVPVFGTVLVIAAGGGGAGIVTSLLSLRALTAIGDRSYSIYLWHWPAIVFAKLVLADAAWAPFAGLVAGLTLSELAFRFVETPIRRTTWLSGRPWAQLATAGVVLLGLAGSPPLAVALPDVLSGGQRAVWADRIWAAAADSGKAYSDGCHLDGPPVDQPECLYGAADAQHSAVLFGDSHAAHWFPALEEAAIESGWSVRTWSKSVCPAARITGWDPYRKAVYSECSQWRDAMLKRMVESPNPLLVFLSSSNGYSGWVLGADGRTVLHDADADAEFERGLAETVEMLQAAGHHVAIIRDTPLAVVSYKDCILANMGGEGCERPREAALNPNLIEQRVVAAHPGTILVDASDAMCGQQSCPVVIDDMIVYRDDSHMTAAFSATLQGLIVDAFRESLGGQSRSLAARQ